LTSLVAIISKTLDRVEEARCVQHARSTEKDAMTRVALLQHLQIAALLKGSTANNKRQVLPYVNERLIQLLLVGFSSCQGLFWGL
jgi:hypothetical protein